MSEQAQSSPRSRFGRGSSDSQGGNRNLKIHNFEKDKFESVLGPFRILPPHGTKKDDRFGWNVYHGVHYGYRGLDFNDRSKTRNRVFECIEKMNFRTKTVEVSCPECRLIEQKEQQLQDLRDEIKNTLMATGNFDRDSLDKKIDDIAKNREDTKSLTDWLEEHNRDGKYYILVLDQEYKPGLVKLAKKHIEAIKGVFDALAKKDIDALNNFDQGAWIYLKRRGKGSDTSHTAYYAEEDIPGFKGATRPQLAPISDEILNAIDKDLPDLGTNPLASMLSADQILLLTECSGDPEEVDAIFKMTERSNRDQQAQRPDDSQQQKPQAQSRLPPANQASEESLPPKPQASAPQTAPAQRQAVDPRVATLQAIGMSPQQIAAILALTPAPAAPAPTPVAAAPTTQGTNNQALSEPEPKHVAKDAPSATNPFDPDMPAEDFAKTFSLPPR